MCFDEKNVALALEACGFSRAIAGEEDFNAAVKAIITTHTFNRGIIIAGEYGVGKTCLANAIVQIFGRGNFRIQSMNDPKDVDFLSEESIEFWADVVYERGVMLDDLGSEKPVNNFGVMQEVIGEFIVSYHEKGRGILIITTNLNAQELDGRYGGRVLSRLKDKCIPLRLKGKDKRQWQL